MARRGMTGQLNMFDLIHSLEGEAQGEVEMVSLVPEFEEELEVVEEPEVAESPEIVEEPVVVESPEIVEEPEVEEAPEVIEEVPELPHVVADAKVAMSRRYEIAGESVEIAYINYNKVRISKGNRTPETIEFATTKEAVDYYVEKMQELAIND